MGDRAVSLLPSVFRKLMIEADFLPALQLHHPAVVDDQLDGPVADRAEGLPELPEERRRERQLLAGPASGPPGAASSVAMILYTLSS